MSLIKLIRSVTFLEFIIPSNVQLASKEERTNKEVKGETTEKIKDNSVTLRAFGVLTYGEPSCSGIGWLKQEVHLPWRPGTSSSVLDG
ncbi:hypothetical protein NPIL_423491 [Nephila pilipes]|uniref:Uncharacterized protein n=1 Tax=Nephila pilipes TaxID=299642 RepID=A0A8X6QQU6_NEPPI|nr:hypothetical protein NPIL_423491 [Nephila pilipes]